MIYVLIDRSFYFVNFRNGKTGTPIPSVYNDKFILIDNNFKPDDCTHLPTYIAWIVNKTLETELA